MTKLIINTEVASDILDEIQEVLLSDKKNYKIPLEMYYVKLAELDVDIKKEGKGYIITKVNRSKKNE